MSERAASIIGFFIAALVVVVVMNKHIFVEIVYDIRGITHPHTESHPSYRTNPSLGFGSEKVIETPVLHRPSSSKQQFKGSQVKSDIDIHWESNTAKIDVEGNIILPKSMEKGDRNTKIETEDVTPSKSGGLVDGTEIPRLAQSDSPAIAVLECSENREPLLWFVGLTQKAVAFRVGPHLVDRLQKSFRSLENKPSKIGVAYYNCSPQVLNSTREVLSTLCSTELSGVMVFDMGSGKQIPFCGF